MMEENSEFILRRDYHHSIGDWEYEPDGYFKPVEEYKNRYEELYTQLSLIEGPALYKHLDLRINLNQYFSKMAIDYLLRNGDYTDEIYLYSNIKNNMIRFDIIPWDYDDIFKSKPHEVGRAWGPGGLFGERIYNSPEDIFAEIGDKMVFSIEDDLDYAIAMDPYVYSQYELNLARILKDLDARFIEALFDQVESELAPFYDDPEVILQSEHDKNATSFILWKENMLHKKQLVIDRLESMRTQINHQVDN
jgi:spore coat protein H